MNFYKIFENNFYEIFSKTTSKKKVKKQSLKP